MLNKSLLNAYLRLPTTKSSKSVLIHPGIPPKVLAKHKALYAPNLLGTPLLMVKTMWPMLWLTSLILTDQEIAYRTSKDAWFTGFSITKCQIGTRPYVEINSLGIGKADHGMGSTYYGHQLIVNDQVLGLVRRGSGITWDSSAVAFLNGLFAFMHQEGRLASPPKQFAWQ